MNSMKNYSDEFFLEQLRPIKFPHYSNYTCVNNAYQEFVRKFLSVINFVPPVRTLRASFGLILTSYMLFDTVTSTVSALSVRNF